MLLQDYDLATLVPTGLYSAQARKLLVAVLDVISLMKEPLPTRRELDVELRSTALSEGVAPVHLFAMLRVILAWPTATPDLFETVQRLGKDEMIARLSRTIVRLGDVADAE